MGVKCDFIFLDSTYEGRWPVLSLTISSSQWQRMVSVLIIAKLTRGCRWSRNLEPNFCSGQDFNHKPLDWQSSKLSNIPQHLPVVRNQWKFQLPYRMLNEECHEQGRHQNILGVLDLGILHWFWVYFCAFICFYNRVAFIHLGLEPGKHSKYVQGHEC